MSTQAVALILFVAGLGLALYALASQVRQGLRDLGFCLVVGASMAGTALAFRFLLTLF